MDIWTSTAKYRGALRADHVLHVVAFQSEEFSQLITLLILDFTNLNSICLKHLSSDPLSHINSLLSVPIFSNKWIALRTIWQFEALRRARTIISRKAAKSAKAEMRHRIPEFLAGASEDAASPRYLLIAFGPRACTDSAVLNRSVKGRLATFCPLSVRMRLGRVTWYFVSAFHMH